MSKAYKVIGRKAMAGDNEGKIVYTVSPVSYGTLTSEDVARQISAESTATPGDVKAVLDRYAYYVKENLKKGYNVELMDFGIVHLRFIKDKAVTDPEKANANLVRGVIPGFRPAYKLVNRARIYKLTPDTIKLVKYEPKTDSASDGNANVGNEDA